MKTPEAHTPVSDDKKKDRRPNRNAGRHARLRSKPRPQGATGGSKAGALIDLLKRSNGATIDELTAAVGWQSHSVRGFLSGTVTKKMKLKLQSRKRKDGLRVYRIAS